MEDKNKKTKKQNKQKQNTFSILKEEDTSEEKFDSIWDDWDCIDGEWIKNPKRKKKKKDYDNDMYSDYKWW